MFALPLLFCVSQCSTTSPAESAKELEYEDPYAQIANDLKNEHDYAMNGLKNLKSIPMQLREVLGACELEGFEALVDDLDLQLSCFSSDLSVSEGEPSLVCQEVLGEGTSGKACKVQDWQGKTMVLKEYKFLDRMVTKMMVRASLVLGKLANDDQIVTNKQIWLKPNVGGGYSMWSTQPLINGVELLDVHSHYWDSAQIPVPSDLLLSIAYQILQTLEKLQAQNVVHLDIKLENAMLDDKGRVLLIDYDFANHFGRDDLGTGTPGYIGPERYGAMIPKLGYYTDMWALGSLLYAMIQNYFPLPDEITERVIEDYDVMDVIKRLPSNFEFICYPDRMMGIVTEKCPLTYILHSCLQKDPTKRKPASKLLDLFKATPITPNPNHYHPAFKSNFRLPYSVKLLIDKNRRLFQFKEKPSEKDLHEPLVKVPISHRAIMKHVQNVVATADRLHGYDYPVVPKLVKSFIRFNAETKQSELCYQLEKMTGDSLSKWWEGHRNQPLLVDRHLRYGILLLLQLLRDLDGENKTIYSLTPSNIIWDLKDEDKEKKQAAVYRVGIVDAALIINTLEPVKNEMPTEFDYPGSKSSGKFEQPDALWNIAMSVASLLSPNIQSDSEIANMVLAGENGSKITDLVLKKVKKSYPMLSYELGAVLKSLLLYSMNPGKDSVFDLCERLIPYCSAGSSNRPSDGLVLEPHWLHYPLVELKGTTLEDWWKEYQNMPKVSDYLCNGITLMIGLLQSVRWQPKRMQLKSITPHNMIWGFDHSGRLKVGLCHSECDVNVSSEWDKPYKQQGLADSLWNVAMSVASLLRPDIQNDEGIKKSRPEDIVEAIMDRLTADPRPTALSVDLEYLLKRVFLQSIVQLENGPVDPISILANWVSHHKWSDESFTLGKLRDVKPLLKIVSRKPSIWFLYPEKPKVKLVAEPVMEPTEEKEEDILANIKGSASKTDDTANNTAHASKKKRWESFLDSMLEEESEQAPQQWESEVQTQQGGN